MRGKKGNLKTDKQDSVYHSEIIQRLIHKIMQAGKKTIAEKIVYRALEILQEKTKKEPMEVFNKALDNVRPTVELRSRRVGGANYQVPMPVTIERGDSLAIRWIVDSLRAKKGKQVAVKLADELLDAANNTGDAVLKKENTHKMAEANKAFAIFRW